MSSKHDEWIGRCFFSADTSTFSTDLVLLVDDVREYLAKLDAEHTYDPKTYVVVPIEPTEEMVKDGLGSATSTSLKWNLYEDDVVYIYKAMIGAEQEKQE